MPGLTLEQPPRPPAMSPLPQHTLSLPSTSALSSSSTLTLPSSTPDSNTIDVSTPSRPPPSAARSSTSASSTSLVSRLPPLPVVPPQRDPSFFIPPLSFTRRSVEEVDDSSIDEEVPRIPQLLDLPHISVLSGLNVPVLSRQLTVEFVPTSEPCLPSSQGAFLVTGEKDAWLSATANASANAPSTSSPSSTQVTYTELDPSTVLTVSLSPHIRLNVLIQTSTRDDASSSPVIRSALLDYQPTPLEEKEGTVLLSSGVDSSPLFSDAILRGFVGLEEEDVRAELKRAQDMREAHHNALMTMTAFDPTQSISLSLPSSNSPSDLTVSIPSSPLFPSTDSPDEVLLELVSLQRELQLQVSLNVQRRLDVGSRIFYHDHLLYRSDLTRYHDNVQTTYRFAVAWQTFRHSLRKGMKDAEVPKHLLLQQLSDMTKASRGSGSQALIPAAAGTSTSTALSAGESEEGKDGGSSGYDGGDSDEFVVCAVCVSEGTLVALANGTSVPIEEVQVGADVLSYYAALDSEETEGLTVRKVEAVLDQGRRDCVELLFSDGRTLVCTPDHRIRTADSQWVAASDLEVGTAEVAVGVEDPNHSGGGEGAVLKQQLESMDSRRFFCDPLTTKSYGVHRAAKVLPLFHVRLVSRRDVGEKHVYDLSVPSSQGEDTRSFIANGVVVHNCFDSSSPEENPVLYCDRCNLTVHRICYGLQAVPDGDWYCSYCEHQRERIKVAKRKAFTALSAASPSLSPDSSYPCVLCTHRGGALKPTTDGRWAHILCAMLVPRARLKDVSRMEPVAGVEDALAAQRQHGRVCCVCKIDYGCTASCSHKHCNVVFHAYCGWLSGFFYQADVNGIDIRFSIFCIAEGTPVELIQGMSVPIEEVEVGDRVHGLSDESTALTGRSVKAVHNRGLRQCVELLFSDGRSLVCTTDHRIRTADGEWVKADHLIVGASEVSVGPSHPLVVSQAERSVSDAEWSLDLSPSLGFVLSMATIVDRQRARAFARLVGFALVSATAISNQLPSCVLITLGHQLDVDAVQRDLHVLGVRVLSERFDCERSVFELELPSEVVAAFDAIGMSLKGDHLSQIVRIPHLFTAASCPTEVVCELLGGMFGGGGVAPSYDHITGHFTPPALLQRKRGSVARAQLAEWKTSLTALLVRCGLTSRDVAYDLLSPAPSYHTVAGSVQLEVETCYFLTLGIAVEAMLTFADRVGYRYSVRKQLCSSAAVAWFRCEARVVEDRCLVREAARPLLKMGRSLKAAVEEAIADVALNRTIHPHTRTWAPLSMEDFERRATAPITAVQSLSDFGTAQFFLSEAEDEAADVASLTLTRSDSADLILESDDDTMRDGNCNPSLSSEQLSTDASSSHSLTSVPMCHLRLIAKRHVGLRRTYDLTVDTPANVEPSFTAAGICVHNCTQHTPDHALARVRVPTLQSSPSSSPTQSPVFQSTPSSTISIAPMSLTPFSNLPVDTQSSWVSTPSLLSFFPVPATRLPPLPPQPSSCPSPVLKRQESSSSSGGLSPLFTPAGFTSSPTALPQLSYPRDYLIELRLYQQRDIRNRAREDRRTKDTTKKLKRMERRRLDRSRALHEDLYQPSRCAICFYTDAELLEKKNSAAAQAMKGRQERKVGEKKLKAKSSWTEVLSQAPASAYPNNRLLRCDQCQIDVHQQCHGTTDEVLEKMRLTRAAVVAEKAEDGEDVEAEMATSGFLCHRCTLGVKDISCCVCPRKGGSLKPLEVVLSPNTPLTSSTSSLKWIHVACAEWIEEVHFKDPVHLEGIEGVSSIPKAKKRLRCCLCKRGGPCIPCSEPGCNQSMHPSCGLFAGVFMQLYSLAQPGAARPRPSCLPKADHQILTSEGFLGYAEVLAAKNSNASLSIACPVSRGKSGQGRYAIEWQPISAVQLISDVTSSLIHFRQSSKLCSSNSMDLLVTEEHRMLAKVSTASTVNQTLWPTECRTAEEVLNEGVSMAAGRNVVASEVSATFLCCASEGVVATAMEALPFVERLRLQNPSAVNAFVELYGYWLGRGSLSAGSVALHPHKEADVMYLRTLLMRCGLTQSDQQKQQGYHEIIHVDGEREAVVLVQIDRPDWCEYFAEEYTETLNLSTLRSTWSWVLQLLSAPRLRLLLRGLRFADGNQAEEEAEKWRLQEQMESLFQHHQFREGDAMSSEKEHRFAELNDQYERAFGPNDCWPLTSAVINTSSPRLRDDIQRAALHAGFTSDWKLEEWNQLVEGETHHMGGKGRTAVPYWNTRYVAMGQKSANPILSLHTSLSNREVNRVYGDVDVWCVAVPTAEQLIIVRRVKDVRQGIVFDASTPTVVGNSSPSTVPTPPTSSSQSPQKTKSIPNPAFRRLQFCPRHTPIQLARFIDVPSSFTQLTLLRSHFDTARVLFDLLKRREKIKAALVQNEVDIQREKWRLTQQQCRDERLKFVTASPTTDNKIRLKLSKAPSVQSSPTSSPTSSSAVSTNPSPVPWFAREGGVDVAVSAEEKVQEMGRLIDSLSEVSPSAGQVTVSVGHSSSEVEAVEDGQQDTDDKEEVTVRKTGRARRSSTLLDASVLQDITPKRRSSQPNTPAHREKRRSSISASPTAAAAAAAKWTAVDSTSTTETETALSIPHTAAPTPVEQNGTAPSPSKRQKITRVSPSQPTPLPSPPPSSDTASAPSPLADKKAKRGYKRKVFDIPDASSVPPLSPPSQAPSPSATIPALIEAGPSPAAPAPKRRGRPPKVRPPVLPPPLTTDEVPTVNGASPPPSKRRALTIASPPSTPAGPKPPTPSFPSTADHSLAPFPLQSSVRVLEGTAYFDAVVCAIDHSLQVALTAKKEGSAGPPIPRGFQWTGGELTRRTKVREEEEWAYYVHYAGWNKRWDEWVVGALVKGPNEGEAVGSDEGKWEVRGEKSGKGGRGGRGEGEREGEEGGGGEAEALQWRF